MEPIDLYHDAFIFDMDGTLVNSEPLKGMALARACEDYGSIVDYRIYQNVMGMKWERVVQYFFENCGIAPNLEEFNAKFKEHYRLIILKDLTLNEGVEKLLKQIQYSGKQCAVVTSAQSWMTDQILKAFDLAHLFDLVITKEHVAMHKPDPESYLLALSRLDVSANKTVIFEDSTPGLQAGLASGCEVIAIRHAFNQNNDFLGASRIIDNFGVCNLR
ncbi:HAD family hydrolase [Vibrio cyclitrophicus]|uniref:Beta-phosphoglucomutase n=2 Tax=Vibrio cyclitrophicus TaxID=47951 RepID=A0A7Z1MLN2_9VIBR|nr:HAD family phosphatase [Vibrio cyclitrophicus]ERM60945.1 Beta-phosphoglucomutase [Vibrio cyclitrophicus FF75]OED90260.1 beta-phosphoglucomutase [Vibrio cyclitrophicus ZF30]OEE18379.1 beta-phosphoglucomutase [Vibrio cyclitrophicus ZF207]OEE48212.1 beta-phosphoglucomutase [Vibrio cyclitrophicus FF75]PMJ31443.1 beta-phosphoglucomutase [Vibrio cyclitrophicus]